MISHLTQRQAATSLEEEEILPMLPFPRAHYYVLTFFLVTIAAFAPSYFLILPKAEMAHHVHGITATLWIVLLMTQNWSIHNRKWTFHRYSGLASMALVPLFTIGGLWVTQVTLLSTSPFKDMFGIRLAFADFVATFAFLAFYGLALRHRKSTDQHARYMLATVILLFGPSIARLLANYVPGFLIRAPEDLPKFGDAVHASMLIGLAICLILIARDYLNKKPVTPFVLGLGATMLMYLGFVWVGHTPTWLSFTAWFAAWPLWTVLTLSLVSGVAAVWWGWMYPAHRSHAPIGAQQPAE
ncbi:MAG: hypothetical protein AAFX02_06835 [Pseudomonadota bacterium]